VKPVENPQLTLSTVLESEPEPVENVQPNQTVETPTENPTSLSFSVSQETESTGSELVAGSAGFTPPSLSAETDHRAILDRENYKF